MYGEQRVSNKRSRISGMSASSMSTLTPTSSFSSTPKTSRTSASSSSASSIDDVEAQVHKSIREAMYGDIAEKTLPGTLVQLTKVVRGKVVVVHHDHIRSGEKPARLFVHARDCGVCLNECRKRWKSTSDCPEKWMGEARGLENGGQELERFINTCKTGCPHVNCRDHPVCKEHWPTFVHVGLEATEESSLA